MILTRIKLDPARRKTMMALNNPNIFHGAIESSRPGERTRILWRLDSLNSQLYLLLLSENPLSTELIEKEFGYPDEKAQEKSYDRFLENIKKGSKWNFRLTANPVFAQKSEKQGERGKVIPYASVLKRTEWLEKKALSNGFSINPEEVRIVHSDWIRFRKEGTSSPVTIKSATYEGVLTVTDPDLFRKALVDGIGRGKAYGLGLLTVVPYHG